MEITVRIELKKMSIFIFSLNSIDFHFDMLNSLDVNW